MFFWLKFAPAFRFFMSKVIAIRKFNFNSKRIKVVVSIILYSSLISLFSSFSSHDGLVCNTLYHFMTKIMTWETLSIKEEIYTIMKPSIYVYLLIDISIIVHPWIWMIVLYLNIVFVLLLSHEALLVGFFSIQIAFSWGFFWLRRFTNLSKTCLHKRRVSNLDNFI